MEYKDYYGILGVDKSADTDDIKKAYRKLARKYHPDVNPDDERALARFKEIDEAHQVLSNVERRAKYDRLQASWHRFQQSGAEGDFDWSQWADDKELTPTEPVGQAQTETEEPSDLSDLFTSVFSDVGQAPTVPQSGSDYNQAVEITLEEAFAGTTRIIRIGDRRIQVKIPRGTRTGTKIRVRGEGAAGQNGGPKGDLYLEITVVPHPIFKQEGDDLHFELPVDLYTAVLGGEAMVPLLKGKVKLKIPPETQSGRTFRLKGQGMPRLKQSDERGDLYAKVMIQIPEELSEEEIALFEELADIRGL
jgi:curved DNA-binding protein